MKKFLVLAVAALAFTVVGGIAVAKSKKIESEVTINFNQGSDPYGEDSTFFGEVNALNGNDTQRKKCEKKRKVTVTRVQPGEDPTFGSTKTDNDGNWVLDGTDAYDEPGQYQATVEKKKKKQAKIICKADTSDPITVP